MTDIPVTTVTKDAQRLEYMHNADYVRMVATLNKALGKSYRWMEKESGCDVSFAQWAQIADGNRKLNPATRKGVRTMIAKVEKLADELPAIPDPVELVAADEIDENAEMVRIGVRQPGQRVKRVLMLADDSDMVIYVNGEIIAERLETPTACADGSELPASAQNATAPRISIVGANYAPTYRPRLPVALKERIEASGVDVATLIERGLQTMEVEDE